MQLMPCLETKMNVLEDSLCYLIGAMDFAPDQGVNWRTRLIRLCQSKKLQIKFLDPTNKIAGLQEEVGEERNKIVDYKNNGDWAQLSSMMRTVVRQDHRCVDLSDFVIFYLDVNIHTCGSYFEFQSALTQKKPYFVIVHGGKKMTPAWLFGICDHNFIFDSVEAVVKALEDINSGATPLTDRWVLFRKQIENL